MFDVNGNTVKLASFVSCDVLIVDVANEYVEPLDPTPRKPVDNPVMFSVPTLAVVADAYANDPRVVDELENVFSAVNVFVVYVLGIVVEAAMYALIALFCAVVSIVRAPPVFVSPVPRSDVNDDPPRVRVPIEAWVVEELTNDA